jgi:stage IV sporulation protein FB
LNSRWKPPFKIRFHLLFWLLFAGAVITGQFMQLLTLFLIILVHEFGHVAAANYCGWQITEIKLLPFGGEVQMNPSSREHPWEEFWIALAGPISNVVMILVALVLQLFGIWEQEWVRFFIFGNAVIALFNLLPIYPLDGGRILQVLLSLYFPFKRAILLSLYLGIGLIILLFALSFWRISLGIQLWISLPYLLFLIITELRRLPYRFLSFLMRRHVDIDSKQLLQTHYLTVKPTLSIRTATEKMFRHRYHLFRIQRINEPVYFGEKRILAEMFEHKRPLVSFSEIEKEGMFDE